MIVPPKKTAEQVKFRWEPDLIERIRRLAEQTHRTMNEAGDLLMRWALQEAEREWAESEGRDPLKRKKQ